MKALRKTLFVLLVIALIIGVFAGIGYTGYWYVQNQKKLAETVRVTSAVRGDLKVILKESATLKPKKTVEIKSKVSGRILDLFYEAGAVIESGSIIAQLDREEYIRLLERAEKDLERARQEWEGLTPFGEIVSEPELISPTETEKLVDTVLIEYGARKVNYLNMRKMFARNLISSKALDDARKAYETSWVTYHQSIRSATKALAEAELQYDQAVEDLTETTIRAPVAGVLTKIPVNEGELVQGTGGMSTGTSLAELADLSEMEALVKLNEVDVGKVKVGNPVALSIDAHEGKKFTGHVERIAPKGDLLNNIVTFEVRIALDERLPFFKPEMTANADILVDMVTDVVKIPLEAVKGSNENKKVTLLKPVPDYVPPKKEITDEGEEKGALAGGEEEIEISDDYYKTEFEPKVKYEETEVSVVTGISNELWTEVQDGVAEGTLIKLPEIKIPERTNGFF